tara:strand:+ start:3132 stop:8384 length:5253 start_codon:yes stop_codon:yes gene_type:complete
MADTKPTFNIFGPVTNNEIRVGYISTDRGYVTPIDICEANRYEKNNPGTIFIYENRDKVLYLDIDQLNTLNIDELIPSKTASDGSCDGLQLESPCNKETVANFYGGGGVGVLGNPIIGTDGAVLAVDIVEGGFGYQYPPIVEVKNGCDIGDGSLFESVLSDDGYTIDTLKYYDECPGIERVIELCPETPVEKAGWGRMFNKEGVDIGPWDPTKYTDNILGDPIDLEMAAYEKQLAEFKNPFWTPRSNTPVTITSDDKVSSLKYDVYHWAWGAKAGINPEGEIDNLYIKLFGRRGEPSGLKYWRDIQASGKNLTQVEASMKTFPEWKRVCEGECKPVMPDVTYLAGSYWEYDKNNFMNKYAISPLPMSNVLGSDGGGDLYSMEWDVEFPYDGNYTFIVQCDNEGTLFVDGEKQSEYNIGAGGASGATLSPPEKKMLNLTKGNHKVRFDLLNLVSKKKVVKPDEFTAKTNDVDFKFNTSSYHGATASIEGLDMYIEKEYGPDKDVSKDFNRKVEYGRVYDVILTSNTFRSETRPSNNRDIIFEGLHPVNNPINVSANRKRLNLRDGDGRDTNASFTIDSGNVKFSADGKRLEGNGEVTINLTWNDNPRRAGVAVRRIKIGTTIWTQSGRSGSESHKITLGNITQQLGSDASASIKLRTKGERVLQMEDIPHVPIEDQKVLFDDVVLTASQGRFFNIQGNKAKYTLDAPLPVDRSSSDDLKVFDTLSFIDKSSRKLWKTNNLSPQQRKDSSNSFSNRYGITPFNPTIEHNTNYPGFHKIVWDNVTFPATADYDITIAVDDNVRLRIGDQVDIQKDGFSVRGDWRTSTGTTVYSKRVKEGTYTLTADLEQIRGGKYGMNANSMLLAIDIRSRGSLRTEVEKKSWNQNPFAVALAIESPPPPPPKRELPDSGDGGCPENPIWSTMTPGSSESWYPANHKSWSEFTNTYALSPVPPLDTPGSDGVGALYKTSWKMNAPYAGNYMIKGTVEDTGKLLVNGREIGGLTSPTELCPKIQSTKVYLEEGTHDIEVQVENKKDYETPKFFIDQKIFNTQDWQNQVSRASGRTKDIDFKITTATYHGATASIEALGIYHEKPFGGEYDPPKDFKRTVEYGRIYDVILTSNTFRSVNVPVNSNQINVINMKDPVNGFKWISSTRIEYDEDPIKNGWDCNAAFTIDNVVGGTAKFNPNGQRIDYTGDNVQVTLTLSYRDRRAADGFALDAIRMGNIQWTRNGEVGSETHTITLGSGTTQIGEDMTFATGSNPEGIKLRTKGERVLQMEDIPHVPIEDQKILFDDVIITVTEGKFFGINGNKAKYVLPEPHNTNLDRGGVTYKGPALFHYTFKSWGSFMNKSSVSPDYPKFGGGELVTYEWSNVDFPRDGEYAIKFQMDHSATLYLDGQKIQQNSYIGVEGTHGQDLTGEGTAKLVKVKKGKHTLSVRPTVYTEESGGPIGFIDALFRKPSQDYYRGTAAFDANPSGFAIGITIKTETAPAFGSKEEIAQRGKSWKDNPTAISAIMIPPPCPKKIKGKGVVVDVIVDDPGGPYPTPEEPPEVSYPVTLKLKKVIPDGGINYDPGDNPIVFPPYSTEEPNTPNDGTGDQIIIDPPNGAKLTPVFGPHGVPIAVNIENPGLGWTKYPTIRMPSDTGVGVVFKPQFEIVRDPLDVAPDKLLQVTDLVGLKQTGYVDGRPYYGAIYYENDLKYAGLYETVGQKIRIYDTLQDSIDAMDRSDPSAIQRSGTDVSSNDPRLDIPNTPDNLI